MVRDMVRVRNRGRVIARARVRVISVVGVLSRIQYIHVLIRSM